MFYNLILLLYIINKLSVYEKHKLEGDEDGIAEWESNDCREMSDS